VRFATWNVNSLKARMPRVEAWLADIQPDVVCLQETKLADAGFPALAFQALGYDSAHHGRGQWNGVAILSKAGLDDVVAGFADGGPPDVDARIVTATCAGIRFSSVYVPNGRAIGHEQYDYKLAWFARLRADLAANAKPGDGVVVCGDFNVAPEDRDVWDITAFEGSTHVTPPEREALADVEGWGLVDLFRHRWPEQNRLYTYWDYRAGDFHQGRGMRIDLVLGSAPVAERVRWCVVDRNARKGSQPSDHAPVVVDLADG
jgi:exodeoxyribonuclease-3